MNSDIPLINPLILFGGAHLAAESAAVWQAIAGTPPSKKRAVLVTAALAEHKHASQVYRSGEESAPLKQLGCEIQVLAIHSRDEAEQAFRLEEPDIIVLSTGSPRTFLETLRYTRAWDVILDAWFKNAMLVALPGSAVALGQHAFAPVRLLPAGLSELYLEYLTGMDMVTETCIVPHYDTLTSDTLTYITAILPPSAILLGIDEHAALRIEGGRCQVLGRGGVAVVSRGTLLRTAAAGTEVSLDSLLAIE